MPLPEHIARQSFEVYAPIDKMGGASSGAPQSENPLLGNKQELVAQIRKISYSPPSMERLHFEDNMMLQMALLPSLEAAGIVPPSVNNPNPYDIQYHADEYQHWVQAHQKEFIAYRSAATQREKVINMLYLGARIQGLVGKQRDASLQNPIRMWSTQQAITEFFQEEYTQRSPVEIDYKLSNTYGQLLPALEETGIVPATPRPPVEWFHWNKTKQKQWLAAHPTYAERATTLQQLHIGMLVEQALENLY